MYEKALNPISGRLGDEKINYGRARRVPGTRTAEPETSETDGDVASP